MSEFDERRVFGVQLRAVEQDRRLMSGVAAPYGEEIPVGSSYIEVLAPGVFKKSIKEAARGLPLLRFHDNEAWPVGKSVDWEETDAGLVGTWEFASTDAAQEAYELARDGFVTGLSVGFQPMRSDVDPGDETRPPKVTRQEARLFEVSMVPTPAYPSAQITLVRTAGLTVARPHMDRWREWAARAV